MKETLILALSGIAIEKFAYDNFDIYCLNNQNFAFEYIRLQQFASIVSIISMIILCFTALLQTASLSLNILFLNKIFYFCKIAIIMLLLFLTFPLMLSSEFCGMLKFIKRKRMPPAFFPYIIGKMICICSIIYFIAKN